MHSPGTAHARAWKFCKRIGANLQEACAQGDALKELVEGEGGQKRADDADVAGHAEGHADQHLLAQQNWECQARGALRGLRKYKDGTSQAESVQAETLAVYRHRLLSAPSTNAQQQHWRNTLSFSPQEVQM